MLAMVTRPGSWELIKSLLPSPAKRGDPQISKIGFNFPDMACDACNQVRDLLLDPTCWLQCIAICASMYQLFSILTWDTLSLGIPNLEQSWYSLFALCPRVFFCVNQCRDFCGFRISVGMLGCFLKPSSLNTTKPLEFEIAVNYYISLQYLQYRFVIFDKRTLAPSDHCEVWFTYLVSQCSRHLQALYLFSLCSHESCPMDKDQVLSLRWRSTGLCFQTWPFFQCASLHSQLGKNSSLIGHVSSRKQVPRKCLGQSSVVNIKL